MEQNQNFYLEEEEKPIDWRSLIFSYLIHWPMILAFVVVSLLTGFIYMRYQTKMYSVSATVLIKQGDQSKNANRGMVSAMAAMQDFGMMSMASNFDNELEIIQSRSLITKVVTDHQFYINYKEDHTFGPTADLYKSSPVNAWMSAEEAKKLPSALHFDIDCATDGSIKVEGRYFDLLGDEHTMSKEFKQLPAVYVTPVGTVTFSLPKDESLRIQDEDRTIKVDIYSPVALAKAYKLNLVGAATSKMTSIIKLDYKDTNVKRGIDFLYALVAQYNAEANDDKNQVATKTAQFIDERIEIINAELGTTETELAAYKQKAGLTNIQTDAQLALQSNSKYEEQRAENTNQIRLIEFLKSYIQKPENHYEVIPANVGLTDNGLNEIISKYNELLIERQRLLRSSNENNPAVMNLDIAIQATRKSVHTTVESVEKGLHITQKNLDFQARKYENRISNAPKQEKDLLSIARQQEIKANLYLMLLEKREENAITLASTANNGRIVEEPMYAGVVSLGGAMVYMLALVLGIGIPVGIIFLINISKVKLENREDVENITDINIIGDLPLMPLEKGSTGVVVKENQNGMAEEVYRSVRTNAQFIMEGDEKVILFTSTSSGEGKSFNAANLAVSFAAMGKKTLIMGMDIRKPGLNKIFQIPRKETGITQYLSDPQHNDLLSLCRPSDVCSNLFIIPGGAVPPNPTELVAREALDKAMAILRKEFDYIIIDTAPIGMVTDTQLIARVADMTIYVCRADYTHKRDLELVNELKRDNKLPKMSILINGINMDKRRNGYYYGYGKYGSYGKYGYGKKYGYGYGYGYGSDK